MLLVAMSFIAVPLWRKSAQQDISRDAANLDILRDQSAELDADWRNGLLTQEAYDQGKRELQGRLVDEINPAVAQGNVLRNPAKALAIVLAVLLPLLTIPFYYKVGTPQAMLPGATTRAEVDDTPVTTEEGVKALQEELASNPENPHGWYKLASSLILMKRYSEAANAYGELVKQVPEEAQLWANYADVYAMAHDKSLQDEKVSQFLSKALELDPNNVTALNLSGSAAMVRKDYAQAITLWQQMVSQVDPSDPEVSQFVGAIKRARELLAAQPGGKEKLAQLPALEQPAAQGAGASANAALTGVVKLSPALAAQVKPDDFVFVLARAAQGPKMPLAVMRKQVKDLPLQFSLDDSMAMQPQLRLSNFDQVVVVARVSKSGSPMAQSGDLQGMTDTVKPGATGLNVTIDSPVP